jgi:DNA polymerase (family 10)
MSYKKDQFISTDILHIVKKIKSLSSSLVLVGSLRRRSKQISDIDFICKITLDKVIKLLNKIKNNFESLPTNISESRKKLSVKYKLQDKLLDKYNKNIQIDFFYVSNKELPFAMLHYTGNFIFNIVMRIVAKNKGYKLNQYGLFPIRQISSTDKHKLDNIKTEKDIFKFLDFVWRPPTNRDIGENGHIHWKKIQEGKNIVDVKNST